LYKFEHNDWAIIEPLSSGLTLTRLLSEPRGKNNELIPFVASGAGGGLLSEFIYPGSLADILLPWHLCSNCFAASACIFEYIYLILLLMPSLICL
jgi:hypothetical protein